MLIIWSLRYKMDALFCFSGRDFFHIKNAVLLKIATPEWQSAMHRNSWPGWEQDGRGFPLGHQVFFEYGIFFSRGLAREGIFRGRLRKTQSYPIIWDVVSYTIYSSNIFYWVPVILHSIPDMRGPWLSQWTPDTFPGL